MEAYCLKCKTKRDLVDPQPVFFSNGTAAMRGTCPVCGSGCAVRAAVGHVRDLLRSQLSVDVANGFTPKYRVPNEKRLVVKELRDMAAKAEGIFLATDPDREGEAIAWHLLEAAELDPAATRRVVFHGITESGLLARPAPVGEGPQPPLGGARAIGGAAAGRRA